MNKGYTYLGCPYAHDDEIIRQARYDAVTEVAAHLLSNGHYVYSPITHNHPLTMLRDFSHWSHQDFLDYDKTILRGARDMIECRLPGWRISKGLRWERNYCKKKNKPILTLSPQDIINPDLWLVLIKWKDA